MRHTVHFLSINWSINLHYTVTFTSWNDENEDAAYNIKNSRGASRVESKNHFHPHTLIINHTNTTYISTSSVPLCLNFPKPLSQVTMSSLHQMKLYLYRSTVYVEVLSTQTSIQLWRKRKHTLSCQIYALYSSTNTLKHTLFPHWLSLMIPPSLSSLSPLHLTLLTTVITAILEQTWRLSHDKTSIKLNFLHCSLAPVSNKSWLRPASEQKKQVVAVMAEQFPS